jgi:hypothetical protein
VALLCLPRLASELSVGHCLAWEGADEVEEEEKEEHAKDGTNNEVINPAADDGARRNGGCGHRCATALAAVASVAVQSGHVVSADSVQAYRGADVGLNKPTDVKLQCTPHHLIYIVDPPVVIVVVVLSYHTIRYSIHEAKNYKYDYFSYIRRKSIVQKNCTQ